MPRILVMLSAAIVLVLGSAHLRLTFVGNKLTPSDPGSRLLGLGASLLGAYAWLSLAYWFRAPLMGVSVTAVCYACGVAWGVIQQRL